MTSMGDPVLGAVLGDRYHITTRLARGGMATVYRAVDTRLTRTVAVKVMHVGLGDDAEFARKLDREARAAARLSHPSVVSVFDQGQDGGRPYIVMEYIEGETLRDVITREAPLTPLRALEVIEPILGALAAAHEAGLVHRDVKPENVLISERGQIKVADFGLAKAISSQTSTATQGLLIGTVSYLPPELVVSGRSDARSDVYSAGVVLFELLTGTKPHTGETPIQVAYAHVHHDVPAPSSRRTAGLVPPYLDALVARATARDADRRPPDAKVLLAQVRRVRAALRDGLTEAPELTQDLRLLSTPIRPDRSDFEVTQYVAPSPSVGHPPPLTVTDAPPPVRPPPPPRAGATAYGGTPGPNSGEPAYDGRPPHQLSAGRLEANRQLHARARRRGWLALLLVLLLTAAAALAGWYLTEGRFTTAPALATLPRAEAETVARQAGLEVRFNSAFSETAARGTVMATDPSPGSKIVDGGRIDAVVSQGPERFEVPKVVGQTRTAATAALEQAKLAVGSVKKRYHERIAAGLVLTASEPAGRPAKRGAKVDLVVSAGPKPIPVSDFGGKSASEAEKALRRAGFDVEVTTGNSDSVPAGRVLNQSPDSGTGVAGDTVKLVKSLGPVLVTVPNVRAMGVKAATEVMRQAGFRVRTQPVAVNYLGVGFVASTDPEPRSRVPKGSTITLFLV
jgi:serine/threonine-protein kinase